MVAHAGGRQKRFEEALVYSAAAIEACPDFSHGYIQLASLYIDQELYLERALELLQFAQALPSSLQPLETAFYSVVLAYNGDQDAAKNILHTIDEHQILGASDKAYLQYLRARVALVQNDKLEASSYCEAAVSMDPKGDSGKVAQVLLQKLRA
jgi:predicted negative regulator of RcsB-dependent stress response